MVVVGKQVTRIAVRLITKSAGGRDADKWRCKVMAISGTMGRERDDKECKRFFRKDQDNWAEMRGEHVRLDFNRPRNGPNCGQ